MSAENQQEKPRVWKGDCLGRKEVADLYTDFLEHQYEVVGDKHFVLNIDADWGGGKSFFIERWAKDLREQGHPVIIYDAWSNDFSRDPMQSLMTKVITSLDTLLKKANSDLVNTLNTAKTWGRKLLLKAAPIAVPAATVAATGIPVFVSTSASGQTSGTAIDSDSQEIIAYSAPA